jgi:hypothetical protein
LYVKKATTQHQLNNHLLLRCWSAFSFLSNPMIKKKCYGPICSKSISIYDSEMESHFGKHFNFVGGGED